MRYGPQRIWHEEPSVQPPRWTASSFSAVYDTALLKTLMPGIAFTSLDDGLRKTMGDRE